MMMMMMYHLVPYFQFTVLYSAHLLRMSLSLSQNGHSESYLEVARKKWMNQ